MKKQGGGGFQTFTDLQYSLHNVQGESANSLVGGEEEKIKKLQSFQLKRRSFLFDGPKAELEPLRGL